MDESNTNFKRLGWLVLGLLTLFLFACGDDSSTAATTPNSNTNTNPTPPTPPTPVAKTYTVSFVTNAGAVFTTQTVKEGSNATRPADPTRDRFNFVNWFKEVGDTTAFNFATEKISNDLTLYAKWDAITYFEVKFVMSNLDGNWTTNAVSVAEGTKATPPALKKAAYWLDGWYNKSNFSGGLFDLNTSISETVSVYGRWKLRRTTSQDFNVANFNLGGTLYPGNGFTYYNGNFYILFNKKLYAYKEGDKSRNPTKDITFTINHRNGLQYMASKNGFYIGDKIIKFITTNGTAVPANDIDLSTIDYGAGDPRNGKFNTQEGFFVFGNDKMYTWIATTTGALQQSYILNTDSKALFLQGKQNPFGGSDKKFIDTGKEIYFMNQTGSTVTLQYYSYAFKRDANQDVVLGTYTSTLNTSNSLGMVAVGDYYYIYHTTGNKVIAFHR